MLLLEVVKPSPASTSEDVGALAARVTTTILALRHVPRCIIWSGALELPQADMLPMANSPALTAVNCGDSCATHQLQSLC